MRLTIHLHVVPSLRVSGAITPLPHYAYVMYRDNLAFFSCLLLSVLYLVHQALDETSPSEELVRRIRQLQGSYFDP